MEKREMLRNFRFAMHQHIRINRFISVLILTVSLLGRHSAASAQGFDSVLQKLDAQYPQEKIYVQYDKSIYNPGETIWLKAYIFSGIYPSPISKTIYAELLNGEGKVIQRKTAPVILSGGAAALDIPDSLPYSTVYVRVYTQWMLNFDSSFIYTHAIPLVNPIAVADKPAPPQNYLQFFPEGGDLVSDVASRIAFKATDGRGWPFRVKGEVRNNKGEKVADFASVHDGMGFFSLTPLPGETYTAVWKDAAGKVQHTELPKPLPDGVVLEGNLNERGIQFLLRRPADKTPAYPYVYVVAQMQQQLLYRARASLSNSSIIGGMIPTDQVPDGIVQVTIFDARERPLAERLFFVNHQSYYFITDLNSAVKDLGKRKKNVIQIDVPDTIPCNLSVSVTDADLNPAHPGEADIFSGLLLKSDIRGYVHHAGYYFSSDADSVQKHLDLVMMTNGWRRFKWEDVLAGRFPEITHLPDNFITINGKINGLNRSELLQKELTGIFVLKNGNQQFFNIPVQPDGRFSVPGLLFYDTARLYYQFNNDKNKVLTSRALFDISTHFLLRPPTITPDSNLARVAYRPAPALVGKAETLFGKQQEQKQEEARRVKTLEAVTVTARSKSKAQQMDEEYTSGFFSGGDGYTFIAEDDPLAASSLSVLQYLQGKVAGLQISITGAGASMTWRGGTPTLFLNEMQGDVDLIQNMTMNDVAMIKVFRPPFFGAAGGGANGAIAVYTKKGKAINSDVKGLDFAKLPGYSPVREFYSPNYENGSGDADIPDIRNTLYWNPFVFTDKENRRIFLSFYNNDVTRRYRVVIEGINTDGKITRIEKLFQ